MNLQQSLDSTDGGKKIKYETENGMEGWSGDGEVEDGSSGRCNDMMNKTGCDLHSEPTTKDTTSADEI